MVPISHYNSQTDPAKQKLSYNIAYIYKYVPIFISIPSLRTQCMCSV